MSSWLARLGGGKFAVRPRAGALATATLRKGFNTNVNIFTSNRTASLRTPPVGLARLAAGFPGFSALGRRTMATHRDVANQWRSSSHGSDGTGSAGFLRFWNQWKVPLLFTGAVIAFDYFVLPRLFELSFMAPVRRRPEYVVYGIIALNAIGFLAWKGRGTMPVMARYGLLQKDPRRFLGLQMLGSAFSHIEWWHMAINMFVLYQFGVPVARWMGASLFLESYLDSAVLSSLGSLMLPLLFRRYANIPSLGASGAVFSTFGTFCYLAPNARLAIWFIPVPFGAWWVFLGTAAWNVFAFVRRTGGGLDYAGHIAGSMCGIAYGYVVTQRARRIREAQAAQRRRGPPTLGWGR